LRSLVKPLLNTAGNQDAKLAPRRGAGSASRWVCCVNGRARWRGLISWLAELHNHPALPSDSQVSPDFDGRSSGILVVHDPRRREYVTPQWLRRDSCGSPLCANSRCRPDAGTVLSITAESVYFQCKDFGAKDARALSVLEPGCASSTLGAAFDRRRNQEMRCLFRSSVKLSRTAGRMERLAL